MGSQAIPGAGRGQVFFVPADQVTIIGYDTKHRCGEHPLWDERASDPVDEAIVRNIGVYGVEVACKIRKNGTHESGKYAGQPVLEVIDGRTRTKACREAARRAEKAGQVPPLLKVELERGSEATQVGTMITLNELRHGDGTMVKAAKAARVLAAGQSEEDVATMFGVETQTIEKWRKLVELAPAVKAAVESGKISATAAVRLHKLSHEEQVAKLAELIANGKPTVAEATDRVKPDGKRTSKPLLPKRQLNKIMKDEEWIATLSEDAQALLRVFFGDKKAVSLVPGLRERLRAK